MLTLLQLCGAPGAGLELLCQRTDRCSTDACSAVSLSHSRVFPVSAFCSLVPIPYSSQRCPPLKMLKVSFMLDRMEFSADNKYLKYIGVEDPQ